MWTKDNSKFSQLVSGLPWTFEAVLSAPSSGSAYASLFNESTGLQIAASEVSTTATVPTLVSQTFSDTATNFTGLNPVWVEIKNTGVQANIYRAGIWVQLNNLAHAEVYYRVGVNYSMMAGDNTAYIDAYNRLLLDTSPFTSATIFTEQVGFTTVAGTPCTNSIWDAGTSDSSLNGSSVQGSALTFSSTNLSIQRSNALNLVSGDRYVVDVAGNPGPGVCNLVNSFLVFQF